MRLPAVVCGVCAGALSGEVATPNIPTEDAILQIRVGPREVDHGH